MLSSKLSVLASKLSLLSSKLSMLSSKLSMLSSKLSVLSSKLSVLSINLSALSEKPHRRHFDLLMSRTFEANWRLYFCHWEENAQTSEGASKL